MRDQKMRATLMFDTAEETHGDGIGITNGRKSFTLVELLVVITIIGILTAMLLTSIARTKKAAQRVECLNFQRQLYIFYYADNWDEDAYEDHPSYTKKELMDSYPRIKDSCYDCHASALTVVR